MALKDYCFDGKKPLKLKEMPTGAGEYKVQKSDLVAKTEENMLRAAELQEKLYAAKQEGLIFALQARDAAGKDSLIKKIFSKLNPAALKITSFKVPNKTDLAHDYMWRINRAMPERGSIGVFNRSHYEDVLVVQVHQMQKGYVLAPRCKTEDFFARRYRQLNNWEEYLWENGFRMVKIFLNVSKEEQKQRFLDRMELPEKHWKLSVGDMQERALWEEYDRVFEDTINATATEHAPWYVLPADNKWYTRYLMSEIILKTLEDMAPEFPPLDAEEAAKIPMVMQELEKE
ncbi:MAG: polyphosphate kinase 2 family protein [Clostridia bacterium]|nr:polyphosphate kinase 2 family protein [Clostridia bacterium]